MKMSFSIAAEREKNESYCAGEIELHPDEERDLFAAFALAGLLASDCAGEKEVAATAYRYADAMLCRRVE